MVWSLLFRGIPRVPLKVPGNKPRKTELYFTVDGKEVVLKKEGGLRLTRIEIIQKSKF